MYKNKIKIASEGGYSDWREGKRRILGQNYTKGTKIFFCPECKQVWQLTNGFNEVLPSWFPKLQPERVCPNCKGSE